jgi:hypothetical protein
MATQVADSDGGDRELVLALRAAVLNRKTYPWGKAMGSKVVELPEARLAQQLPAHLRDTPLTYSRAAAHLLQRGDAVGFWAVARCKDADSWNTKEVGVVDPATADLLDLTERELFVRAVRAEPTLADAWNSLGCHIRATRTTEVIDGVMYTFIKCLEQAVRHNPRPYYAWFNLASQAWKVASHTLVINGETLKPLEMLRRSVEGVGADEDCWAGLARLMFAENVAELPVNDVPMSGLACFGRAIQEAPEDVSLWLEASHFLARGGTMTVGDTTVDRAGCLARALAVDRGAVHVWVMLADCLASSGGRRLDVNGEALDSRSCVLRALDTHARAMFPTPASTDQSPPSMPLLVLGGEAAKGYGVAVRARLTFDAASKEPVITDVQRHDGVSASLSQATRSSLFGKVAHFPVLPMKASSAQLHSAESLIAIAHC